MDNIVLVTGASRGIGKAIAHKFASNNYTVIGTSRTTFEIDDKLKGNFFSYSLDVSSRDSVNALYEKLKSDSLLPSIIINNAGITSDQLFLRMKDEDWDSVINTNLSGVFNVTKAFIKPIIKNKKGSILNISSVSGLMGNAGQVNYSASKAGLSGFTKSLAKEIGSRNITVNSIAPGFIETDMTDFLEGESKEDIINSIPLKRLGKANEVAELAFFLTTNEGAYITGQTISIDGGLFMY